MLVPVRRVRSAARARRGLDLGQPRRRPVDLDRLAAGVLGARASAGGPTATALPCGHDRHRVGEALGLLDVVRRHQDRRALAAQAVDQRPQLLAHLRVEADGRLVEQHEPRAVHERAGDQQPPAHAARELVDPRVAAVAQVGDLERALDRRPALGARDPVEVREDEQVLLDGQRRRRGCRAAARRRTPRAPPSSRRAARSPSTSSSPSSAIACAVSIRIVVDLPAPLGPSRPTHVPSGTSRSRPSTAVIGP